MLYFWMLRDLEDYDFISRGELPDLWWFTYKRAGVAAPVYIGLLGRLGQLLDWTIGSHQSGASASCCGIRVTVSSPVERYQEEVVPGVLLPRFVDILDDRHSSDNRTTHDVPHHYTYSSRWLGSFYPVHLPKTVRRLQGRFSLKSVNPTTRFPSLDIYTFTFSEIGMNK